MKVLSRCYLRTHGPQSLTVGSHICWVDPRSPAARVPFAFGWDPVNASDFWTSSVLEAYDHLGGETWWNSRRETVSDRNAGINKTNDADLLSLEKKTGQLRMPRAVIFGHRTELMV